MCIRRNSLLSVLFLLFVFRVEAEVTAVYPGTDLQKIFNKPALISSDVFLSQDNLIMMNTDAHAATDIPLYKLRSVICDYAQYHNVFKRCSLSGIAETTETGIFQDLGITVKLMGIPFTGLFRVFVMELINDPSRFSLAFTYVSQTGTIRNMYGQWYFETLYSGGIPYTYVRFALSGATARKIPLQKSAISLVIGPELVNLLEQLLAASRNKL